MTARAGTISRISGIRFADYQRDFLDPLQSVVMTLEDPYTGDIHYRARHARVAQFVFRGACPTDGEKVAQLTRIIEALDPGYSTDSQVLQDILRGRKLNKDLSDVEAGRMLYRAAVGAFPANPFILQQWAIFEMHHRHGSLPEAEDLARRAREIEPRSGAIAHTQAEVARRRAYVERSPVLKEQFRRQARERLDEMGTRKDPVISTSRCKLLIDEIEALGEDLSEDSKEHVVTYFAGQVRMFEDILTQARELAPDSPELQQVEARLHEVLERPDKALRALERAFALGARGAGVAIRLANAYASRGQIERALGLFATALDRAPDDKQLHFEKAKLLLATDGDRAIIKGHLAWSYSRGDHNFESRYLHAQFLFMTGAGREAADLFADVEARAPADWRSSIPRHDSLVSRLLGRYGGTVRKHELGYLFVRCSAYPDDIYGRHDQATPDDWVELAVGAEMNFAVRFTRTGPVAVDMKPGRISLSVAV